MRQVKFARVEAQKVEAWLNEQLAEAAKEGWELDDVISIVRIPGEKSWCDDYECRLWFETEPKKFETVELKVEHVDAFGEMVCLPKDEFDQLVTRIERLEEIVSEPANCGETAIDPEAEIEAVLDELEPCETCDDYEEGLEMGSQMAVKIICAYHRELAQNPILAVP